MKSLLAIFISGVLVVSGYSQTRNVLVNSNNAVVSPTNFWSVDASNARTGLGLGTAATNPASAFQPSSATLSNLASSNAVDLTNLQATNIIGVIPASNISSLSLTNISGTLAISNGGSGATTASGARTNFELGATWLTNTVVSDFRTAIGLPLAALTNTNASNFRVAIGATTIGNALFTATNSAAAIDAIGISTNFSDQLLSVSNIEISTFTEGSGTGFVVPSSGQTLLVKGTNVSSGTPAFYGWNGFESAAFSAAQARTNLGLNTWTTNTNSPVFVGTNGEVVSPTNFWQVAPINTVLQNITNVVGNSTNAATNARMLFLYSLASTVTNVTSTITLPTNGSTFGGDVATITHLGPTSSVTAIRALGSGTNIIALNKFEESVRFIYRDNEWKLMDNISYIEPIFFSGTNAVANATASRTNLGLGATNDVEFGSVSTATLKESGNIIIDLANSYLFNTNAGGSAALDWQGTTIVVGLPISFSDTTNAATTRTNLGLGATNNVTFNDVTASGTLTATSTVTAKTNLVVEGFVDYTAARTNNTPTNTPNFAAHAAWIEVKVGTNSFFLPAYQ